MLETKLYVPYACYVSNVRMHIIPISKLDDEGYPNHLSVRRWKLTKASPIISKCQKLNSLYLMHVMVSGREVNVANKNVSIELWHKRLGHMSKKGLAVLQGRILCLR